jgi:hypothetical protein
MNRLLRFVPLMLLVCSASIVTAADSTSRASPGRPADNSPVVGRFMGKWKSSSDTTGDLRLTLKQDAAAAWSAEASFSYQDKDVSTTMKTVQIDGTKVQLVFDWQIDGTAGQSKIIGELTGDTLKGTYQTSGAAGNSSGTWSVSRSAARDETR